MRASPLWRWAAGLRDAVDRRIGAVYEPKKFWDSHADRYVRERANLAPTTEGREIDTLIRAVTTFAPSTTLEVGCAYGRLIRLLAERSDAPWMVGTDLSAKMINYALGYLASQNVPLVQADAVHLPFGDRTFDVVYTYGLLMHVPPKHIATVVAELSRVASRGIACLETAPPNEEAVTPRRSYSYNRAVFAHDYKALFADVGWATTDTSRIGRRVCFVCEPRGILE